MYSPGIDLAHLNDVLCLNDRHLSISPHRAVEICRGVSELTVAQLIRFPRLHKRVIPLDTLFHDVAFPVENLDVPRLAVARHTAVFVVPERQVTSLHYGPKS